MRASRRSLLLGAAAAALAACHRSGGERPPPPPIGGAWRTLDFAPSAGSPEGERALLLTGIGPGAPVLVALHGRGESARGLDVGASAWPREYELDRIHRRLLAPPLTDADLLGIVDPARLAALNASVEKAPYKGLALATPYAPDLPDKSAGGAQGYARFVIDALLPRARAEADASTERARTGIDGVSMGGRLALLVGLTHPDVFATVGALQPAIRAEEAPMLAALAASAVKAGVRLRLVSSHGDYFLPAVRALAAELDRIGVAHELLLIPGDHGYAFNRGPGGAELLLWHERVLRGLPAP